MKNRPEIKIPNYLFDMNMKPGKYFPEELARLTIAFDKPDPAILFHLSSPSRRLNQKFRKEISLAEKTFMDFYFPENLAREKQAMHKRFINSLNDWGKSNVLDLRLNVKKWCIETINKRLKNFYPQLRPLPMGQYENYILDLHLELKKNNQLGQIQVWEWLAKVIERLDPKLVHRCAYCQKVFFSRQKKKFHSQCRSKYFSEKYVNKGISAKRQKEYRERLRAKSKGPKKA